MIKIGSRTIDTKIFLAPLSGCSDLSFRLISREHGARFCFYEMVDSNSLVRRKCGNQDILKRHAKDTPVAGQLLGSDPQMMLDAAQKLTGLVEIAFLDVNCACPAKKAIKKKSGAYLLRDKPLIGRILKKLSEALSIPVTLKIRTGFDRADYKELREIAKVCQANGGSAIFVHGRTRAQGYTGDIDYQAIKTVKECVSLPVIGSGNIFTPGLAKRMFDETGCDGIAIARGALGNPWIFGDIEEYLKTGLVTPPIGLSCKKDALKKHLAYIDHYKEILPSSKIGFMRKTAIWYMKGFANATEMRRRITRTQSYADMIKLIDGPFLNIQCRAAPKDPYRKDA